MGGTKVFHMLISEVYLLKIFVTMQHCFPEIRGEGQKFFQPLEDRGLKIFNPLMGGPRLFTHLTGKFVAPNPIIIEPSLMKTDEGRGNSLQRRVFC